MIQKSLVRTVLLLTSPLLLARCSVEQFANGTDGGTPGAAASNRCAGFGLDDVGCACTPGAQQVCWTGDPALRGRGSCHDGMQVCGAAVAGGETFANPTWGPCTGAVQGLSCVGPCTPSEVQSCETGNKDHLGSGDTPGGVGTDGGSGGMGGTGSIAPACNLPYPFSSANSRTSVVFNEASLLTGVSPAVARASDVIKAFYVDEHALTLGANGGGHTVSPFVANLNAVAGTVASPALSLGDPAAADPAGRPIYPALFLTDITVDKASMAGDWQNGGTAIAPTAVFGTWKTANGSDPAQNRFDVGNGDTVPRIAPGGHDADKQNFSAEAQWQASALGLLPGHSYRVQIMMHDGDQNQSGGDVGEGCVVIQGQ